MRRSGGGGFLLLLVIGLLVLGFLNRESIQATFSDNREGQGVVKVGEQRVALSTLKDVNRQIQNLRTLNGGTLSDGDLIDATNGYDVDVVPVGGNYEVRANYGYDKTSWCTLDVNSGATRC